MFANGVQWALVGNLLITLFLMQFPQYQGRGLFEKLSIEAEADRFAGLWGNANHAGLVSLLILVLSHWATRWVAVVGRFSGLLIIYLTASRTAFLISGSLFLVHFLFFSTMRERMKVVAVGAVLGLMGFLYIGIAGGGKTLENLGKNPVLSRVLDISESNTRAQGQQSRLDLLKRWMPKVAAEPWYGYGLYSMGGSESKEIGFRPGFPDQGTHNLYVGILVDVGWVGLLTFLGTIGYQLWKVAHLRLTSGDRRMVFSLAFIVFVFAFANHNMVTDYPGWIAFPLLFHIPAILALPESRVPAGAASR
jgi:O-antigen ligase